jgi:dTDP-4-dehydrorhamnose 3,5-epimerase
MEIKELSLKGLKLIIPKVFKDSRGFFLESYKQDDYIYNGVVGKKNWVQENHSRSLQRVIRGIHYQNYPGQTKLVRCSQGAIIDVVVDLRPDSDTFGQHEKVYLDGDSHHQLLVPVGFGHSFVTLSATADVQYKVDSYYNGAEEKTLQWNDQDLNINWEINNPIVSERDQNGQSFAEFKRNLA